MRLKLISMAAVALVACAPQVLPPEARITAFEGEHPVGQVIVLDGSASVDPQERPLQRVWTLSARPTGSAAAVEGAERGAAFFRPDVEGSYEISLVVSNGLLTSEARATVEVACNVAAPEVTLGAIPDANRVGAPVQLTGSASDADEASPCSVPQQLRLSWRFVSVPAGSSATFEAQSSQRPWFTPDVAGDYVFEAVATDASGRTGSVRATVTVGDCGTHAPVIAEAGASAAAVGSPVALSVVATDPDVEGGCAPADGLSYRWRIVRRPSGSRAEVRTPTLAETTLVPDVAGDWRVEVTVFDGTGLVAVRAVDIAVDGCGANAPTLASVTSEPVSPNVGQPVSLAAEVVDGDTACGPVAPGTWKWSLVSLPAGSQARLNDDAAARPWFTPDVPGIYGFRAQVTDATGRVSAPASVEVTVATCGAATPSAAIAFPATATLGAVVEAIATVSDADLEAPCLQSQQSYFHWRIASMPAGSAAKLSHAHTRNTSLVPDVPGRYLLSLVVSDSTGRVAPPVFASMEASDCGGRAPTVVAEALPAAPNVGQTLGLKAVVSDLDDADGCGAGAPSVSWSVVSLPAGSQARLSDPASATPWLTPDLPGAYVVRVVATDATGRVSEPVEHLVEVGTCGSAPPSVSIEASSATSSANARIVFTGSAHDADADAPCSLSQPLSWSWRVAEQPGAATPALEGLTTSTPWFEPAVPGPYVIEAVVTDAAGGQGRARATVVVDACGANAPSAVINAPAGTVLPGSTVLLSSTVTDSDDAAECQSLDVPPPVQGFTWAWRLESAPTGSRATLAAFSTATPSLVPDVPGEYEISLVVRDQSGHESARASATVEANDCGLNPPAAVSIDFAPASVNVGQPLGLLGGFTDIDADGSCAVELPTTEAHTFSWRLEAAPPASRARFTDAARQDTSFVPDVPGTYTFALTVSDQAGQAVFSRSLTVGTCGSAAPSVAPAVETAGALVVGSPVLLDAHPTDADIEAPCNLAQHVSVLWELVEVPAGSLAWFDSPRLSAPTLIPDVDGTYVARVTPLDETGRRGQAETVSFTVEACGATPPVAQVEVTSPQAAGPGADVTLDPLLSCTVQFDARTTSDADVACGLPQAPQQLNYAWTPVEAPKGSVSRLSNERGMNPWFSPDVGGRYVFQLTADDGALTSDPARLTIVHAGFDVKSVDPPVACALTIPSTFTLTAGGQGFLRLPGKLPTVVFNEAVQTVASMSGCTPTGVAGVQSCTTLTFNPALALLGPGDYPITVTNPVDDGCQGEVIFSVGLSPQITSVNPTQVCALEDPLAPDQFNLGVNGSGFVSATQLSLSGGHTPVETSLVNGGRLVGLFDVPPPGLYDVSVTNGSSCSDTLTSALAVLDLPLVFFVDPPVLYDGISTQVTLYVSGLNGASVTSVRIRKKGASGSFTNVPFTFDPTRPNQVQAVIPKGLDAGEWDVAVTDGASCSSIPVAGFEVTEALTVALSEVDPPFGWTNEDTAVDLRITTPLPTGKTGFSGAPRVYLNPVGGTGQASALRAVSVVDATHANAVIRAGLTPGEYDVIVVNDDGSVGLLPGGFEVTSASPPIVDVITPGSVPNGGTRTITLRGSGFTPATTVAWLCQQPGGATVSLAGSVVSSSATALETTLNTGSLTAGAVCVARATNADGSYGDFSALGITNSSENLSAFSAATSMTTARRSPAVASGRPTRTARFLYAIGGDTGSPSSALSTVETAPLDRFGNLGAWRPVPQPLPEARTYASARRVGRYVYLVGGQNGSTPLDSVLRAEVLRPEDAPDIDDLFLELAAGGLTEGVWNYRVSAVMAVGDADNPDGETLPGDRLALRVPAGLPSALRATVSWTPMPGAASYRIYRSPSANDPAGTERLVGTVAAPTTSFVDEGSVASSAVPLQLGDLGRWATLPSLDLPRAGLALGFGVDPSDADKSYLYAIAGRTGTSSTGSDYEYLPITTSVTGDHSIGTWTRVSTNALSSGRWHAGAFIVDEAVTTRITPGDTWLYVGPGQTAAGSAVNVTESARVQTGGLLSTWETEATTNNRAGYAFAAAANQLFIFGGSSGLPDSSAKSAELCEGGGCPPGLRNWNAGISLSTARAFPGSVVESGRIFVLGGTDGQATATTESVVW